MFIYISTGRVLYQNSDEKRGSRGSRSSAAADNGCEFLSQERLDRAFKAETYYTRAYASYEKGAVENCNRLVRRRSGGRAGWNMV